MRKQRDIPKSCLDFRNKRIGLGLTQEELALKMGMYQSGISRIERGDREPTKVQKAFINSLTGKDQ